MDLTIPTTASELSAAFLQAGITAGLTLVCLLLYRRYQKPYFGYWALAWAVYTLRMGAIISFLVTSGPIWLYWHQVATGWTALALLWAAMVFAGQAPWRSRYLLVVLFPPVWSYLAIYRLDNFLLAAGPAVLFLSLATFVTGWAFLRYHRRVRSGAALLLAVSFFLWAVHHLDYPFLRARGAWNPWGYYLDVLFALFVGGGLLLLVLEDLDQGLQTLSTLSGGLQRRPDGGADVDELVRGPLGLPAVRGSALFLDHGPGDRGIASAAGACAPWVETLPPQAAQAIEAVMASGRPEIRRAAVGAVVDLGSGHAYTAALPILRGQCVVGAMVVVGDARDPFAALDERFLVALGQQVGAALENADLAGSLAARTKELERLASSMVQQQERERKHLSRELHDETAQVLAAINMQLGLLREAVAPELTPRLDRARELLGAGIRSIRSVTEDLRPPLLDDLGLVPALRGLVDEFTERSRLKVEFHAPTRAPELAPEAEVALFRALQEGLANAARHAEAASITVDLYVEGEEAHLRVTDDGKGMSNGAGSVGGDGEGSGLTGMRERIAALGGRVSLESELGGGVDLRVHLPLRRPEAP